MKILISLIINICFFYGYCYAIEHDINNCKQFQEKTDEYVQCIAANNLSLNLYDFQASIGFAVIETSIPRCGFKPNSNFYKVMSIVNAKVSNPNNYDFMLNEVKKLENRLIRLQGINEYCKNIYEQYGPSGYRDIIFGYNNLLQ